MKRNRVFVCLGPSYSFDLEISRVNNIAILFYKNYLKKSTFVIALFKKYLHKNNFYRNYFRYLRLSCFITFYFILYKSLDNKNAFQTEPFSRWLRRITLFVIKIHFLNSFHTIIITVIFQMSSIQSVVIFQEIVLKKNLSGIVR